MRVVIVAGTDPGHAFPAIALCQRFHQAGDSSLLLTGSQWLSLAHQTGISAHHLLGLAPQENDNDDDAGAKIHQRAARMAVANQQQIDQFAPDLIVSDVLTACGGLVGELLDIPWIELNPHPLYLPSQGLPPLGTGLAPGKGWIGHIRDHLLRTLTARSLRQGHHQRNQARRSIGLTKPDTGPLRRLIATLPALEVPRPDWPQEAFITGPLHFEPTDAVFFPPPETKSLIVVAPSTATPGVANLAQIAIEALRPGVTVPVGTHIVISQLTPFTHPCPPWVSVGLFRQDRLLENADLLICGSGHGIVAKGLLAAVPMVVVPGGGDQWEIANRLARQGSGVIVRPLTPQRLTQAVNVVLTNPRFSQAAYDAQATRNATADPVNICREALQDS